MSGSVRNPLSTKSLAGSEYRAQLDALWQDYDALVRIGHANAGELRDGLEELCFQIGVLEGLQQGRELTMQLFKGAT